MWQNALQKRFFLYLPCYALFFYRIFVEVLCFTVCCDKMRCSLVKIRPWRMCEYACGTEKACKNVLKSQTRWNLSWIQLHLCLVFVARSCLSYIFFTNTQHSEKRSATDRTKKTNIAVLALNPVTCAWELKCTLLSIIDISSSCMSSPGSSALLIDTHTSPFPFGTLISPNQYFLKFLRISWDTRMSWAFSSFARNVQTMQRKLLYLSSLEDSAIKFQNLAEALCKVNTKLLSRGNSLRLVCRVVLLFSMTYINCPQGKLGICENYI